MVVNLQSEPYQPSTTGGGASLRSSWLQVLPWRSPPFKAIVRASLSLPLPWDLGHRGMPPAWLTSDLADAQTLYLPIPFLLTCSLPSSFLSFHQRDHCVLSFFPINTNSFLHLSRLVWKETCHSGKTHIQVTSFEVKREALSAWGPKFCFHYGAGCSKLGSAGPFHWEVSLDMENIEMVEIVKLKQTCGAGGLRFRLRLIGTEAHLALLSQDLITPFYSKTSSSVLWESTDLIS